MGLPRDIFRARDWYNVIEWSKCEVRRPSQLKHLIALLHASLTDDSDTQRQVKPLYSTANKFRCTFAQASYKQAAFTLGRNWAHFFVCFIVSEFLRLAKPVLQHVLPSENRVTHESEQLSAITLCSAQKSWHCWSRRWVWFSGYVWCCANLPPKGFCMHFKKY